MTNATPSPITNRYTRYEVAATHVDGRRVVVGFTSRVSRIGLLKSMQVRGEEIIAHCGITDSDMVTFACRPRVHAVFGASGWSIGFTGRTERDVLASF